MLIRELIRVLAPYGLNLIGATSARAYDALVPPTHRLGESVAGTIIVIGNGGGKFWAAYRGHVAAHPEDGGVEHPLDAFTLRVMESEAVSVARRLGLHPTLHLPFRETSPRLSFMHLAEAAGLGRRGLLGVLIHPEFGPWIALRGALLVDAVLTAPRPAAGFDPCPGCRDRPCIRACPGEAIASPTGWDVPRCVGFRVERGTENPCHDRCHARVACVYGRHHCYPPDALAYHQHRAFTVMREVIPARAGA